MNESNNKIGFKNSLLNQFDKNWEMAKIAIYACPEDKWHSGTEDWVYSFTIYHIIETADFYSRDNPETMNWGKKAGIDWNKDQKEDIEEKKLKISKEFLLNYLEEIRERIRSLLSETDDNSLLQKDKFHWFDSVFEKLLYLLRHNSHHIGELARTLRDYDCDRIKWN